MDFQPSYKEFATIFKALSDETRLRIVDMLSCREMSACDILSNFTLSQSTLSYHMKILVKSKSGQCRGGACGPSIPLTMIPSIR